MRPPTIILLAALTILCGCSSIAARKPAYPEADHCYPGVYPGVRHAVEGIGNAEVPGFPKTIIILDVPVSAVLDTLLLPYDWPHSAGKDSR